MRECSRTSTLDHLQKRVGSRSSHLKEWGLNHIHNKRVGSRLTPQRERALREWLAKKKLWFDLKDSAVTDSMLKHT